VKKSPSATYEVFEKFFSFHDASAARAGAGAGTGGAGTGAGTGTLGRGEKEGKERKEEDASLFTPGQLVYGSRKPSIDEGDQDSGQVSVSSVFGSIFFYLFLFIIYYGSFFECFICCVLIFVGLAGIGKSKVLQFPKLPRI
jgi:hypothetical protein